MAFISNLVHHPRKLFLRRALFQIHLWAGVLLSLYLIVISLSGSILVFQDELTATTFPSTLAPYDIAKTASIPDVIHAFNGLYPGGKITFLTVPTPTMPAYQLRAIDAQKHELRLLADPQTAAIQLQPRNWLNVVHDLHIYLLLGSKHGIQINGVGGVVLLLLCITGLFLWWPGVKLWIRGLRISFRHSWRRINFDAHNAIGIWTLVLVSWWAISGIYFAWYKQVGFVVNAVSPLKGMVAPKPPPPTVSNGAHASLEEIITAAQQASPHGRLNEIGDPSLSGSSIHVYMDLRAPNDFSHRDIVTIDASNAHVLTVWHYGQNQTLGDWIVWSMFPFHFGTLWGLSFKILWFLLGLSLAVLTATGLLMYWNRYLRHHWRRLINSSS